ncbi:TRAP transporter substrate-binding protein [Salsuginibacillus kocurii]|uniref:TRAP transporter substrate-binding protein n=1 Tax=Salsuginibacillus kocurii TaxID=427078 RepID=UPI000381A2AE|nr:TRAP transporter substrate-binding protein [Salsuginibacillus kocurii]
MKNLLAICAFVILGILTSVYIGFGQGKDTHIEAEDRELDGLKEKYVLHFSHIVAENTPKGRAASRFAQKVEEKTDGWVEIQVHPNGILYEAQEEFEALRNHEVNFIAPAFSEIAVHEPAWMIMDLPYAFQDYDEVNQAVNGPIGEKLFDSIDNQHYKGLDFWDNGFKQLTNDVHPLNRPDDIEGLSFRVMPSDVLDSTFSKLGGNPYVYPFNQVFSILNEDIVDGTENTLSNIYSKGFYTEQEYMTLSNHNYLGYAVLTNQSFWKSLPTEYQESIEEAMNETTEWLNNYAKDLNQEMEDRIRSSAAIEITELSTEEKKIWRERLQPVYDRYEEQIGKDLMNELSSLQNDN